MRCLRIETDLSPQRFTVGQLDLEAARTEEVAVAFLDELASSRLHDDFVPDPNDGGDPETKERGVCHWDETYHTACHTEDLERWTTRGDDVEVVDEFHEI